MMFPDRSPTVDDSDVDELRTETTHSNKKRSSDNPFERTHVTTLHTMSGQDQARAQQNPHAPNFAQLANAFDAQDKLIISLRQENQLLHRKLASMNGVELSNRKRQKSIHMTRLPPNVVLCASTSEVAHLMAKITQSDKFGVTIYTNKEGIPQITFKPDVALSVATGLVEFAHAHAKRPSINEKAIVLSGKHRGEHVTVLGINAKDDSAVVKVERMTKAAKESNVNECDVDSTDDEAEDDVMNMEWFPNDVKTDVPLTMLAVRLASGTSHS
jgi:ribosomal protein L24